MSNANENLVVNLKDFRAGDAGRQVMKALSNASETLAGGLDRWSGRAKSAVSTTGTMVRSNPWQTAGVLAMVGVAAGFVMARNARRTRAERAADVAEILHD